MSCLDGLTKFCCNHAIPTWSDLLKKFLMENFIICAVRKYAEQKIIGYIT